MISLEISLVGEELVLIAVVCMYKIKNETAFVLQIKSPALHVDPNLV